MIFPACNHFEAEGNEREMYIHTYRYMTKETQEKKRDEQSEEARRTERRRRKKRKEAKYASHCEKHKVKMTDRKKNIEESEKM